MIDVDLYNYDAIDEIIDVHSEKRYAKFTALTQDEVVDYISEKLKHRFEL
jgi:hypothetical protein